MYNNIEFQEVSQIDLRMEVTRQFPFLFSDGTRMAVAKQSDGTAIVLELSKAVNADENFHLSIDEVRPTSVLSVVDKNDAAMLMTIYNSAPILERQVLLLDPVYALILSTEPQHASIVNISLPPPDSQRKLEIPVAVVTNGGVCEIRTKRNNLRVYDHTLISISQIWQEVCIQYRPDEFDSLENLIKYYSDLVFTVTCWSDQGAEKLDWTLFAATRSGLIVTFSVSDSTATIRMITKTVLNCISFLKFFSFVKNEATHCILLAGSTNGQLKVFLQSDQSLTETALLWESRDNMTIHCAEVNYYESINEIIVVTCKGAHILVFYLSADGRLLKKTKQYLGNMAITGIQFLKEYQYVVCMLNSKTQLVEIQADDTSVSLSLEEISNPIDCKTYEVLGMITSRNKVAWFFLQFPIQLFEHKFRNPTMITVCSINTMDALTTLSERNDLKLYELDDCAEIIRCSYLKQGIPDQYSEFVWVNEENRLIRQLKVFATVLLARKCYHKKKQRNDDAMNTENEIKVIRHIIDTWLAFKRLNRLSNLPNLTSVQKISGVYFRKKMLDFCQGKTPTWMEAIRENFVPSIHRLLLETEEFNQAECEKCVYCDDYVNLETGTCKSNHNVARCCITFLQIPLFSARSCNTCQYAAISDDNLLKQILCVDEKVACPLCDAPLTGPKTEIFVRER